jgi:hypothetical protein
LLVLVAVDDAGIRSVIGRRESHNVEERTQRHVEWMEGAEGGLRQRCSSTRYKYEGMAGNY